MAKFRAAEAAGVANRNSKQSSFIAQGVYGTFHELGAHMGDSRADVTGRLHTTSAMEEGET